VVEVGCGEGIAPRGGKGLQDVQEADRIRAARDGAEDRAALRQHGIFIREAQKFGQIGHGCPLESKILRRARRKRNVRAFK
jgi:hypothetical protein